MKPNSVVITGIVCLTAIQIAAMYFGINGTFRTIVAIMIAGAIGVAYPTPKSLAKARKK